VHHHTKEGGDRRRIPFSRPKLLLWGRHPFAQHTWPTVGQKGAIWQVLLRKGRRQWPTLKTTNLVWAKVDGKKREGAIEQRRDGRTWRQQMMMSQKGEVVGPFSAIRAKILKMEEIGGIALSRHFIYLKGAKDKNENQLF
jgi:hypothetical protein